MTPPRFDFIHASTNPTGFRLDASNNVLYASFSKLNRVDKISLLDYHVIASVDVFDPGPLDLTADGQYLFVASLSQPLLYKIGVADFSLLNRYNLPAPLPNSGNQYAGSSKLCVTSDNKAFMLGSNIGLSTQFDINRQSFDPITLIIPGDPTDMACSGNHDKVVFAQSVYLEIYDSSIHGYTNLRSIDEGVDFLQMNDSGDRIFYVFYDFQAAKLVHGTLLDGNLGQIATWELDLRRMVGASFSPNGKTLALLQSFSPTPTLEQATFIKLFDGRTGGRIRDVGFNYVDDVSATSAVSKPPVASDNTGLFFMSRVTGIGIFDITQSWGGTYSSQLVPTIFGNIPHVASAAGTTNITTWRSPETLPTPELWVGGQLATNVAQGPLTLITNYYSVPVSGTVPALNTGRSTATVQLRFPGMMTVLTDGYSETCSIMFSLPSAVVPGRSFAIVGFGFNTDPGGATAMVGGVNAVVTGMATTTYPLLYHGFMTLSIEVPANAPPGPADITLNTGGHTCSQKKSVMVMAKETSIPLAAQIGQMAFDGSRHRLYASSPTENVIRVFDTDTFQSLTPIAVGHYPTYLAVLPDKSKLAVTNAADHTATVVDLISGTVVATYPIGTAELQLGASTRGTFFIGSSELDPTTGVLSPVKYNFTGYVHDLEAASRNGKFVVFSNYLYDAERQEGRLLRQNGYGGFRPNAGISDDGNAFFIHGTQFDSNLNAQGTCSLPGWALSNVNIASANKFNPSGSLMYVPTSLGFDFCDVGHSRLLYRSAIANPPPNAVITRDQIALDDSGKRVFLQGGNGISVLEFAELPLSIGHLSPPYATISTSTAITIRGSGFKPGITASLGNVQLQVTYIDEATLQAVALNSTAGPVALTLTNPDGTSYTLAASFNFVESVPFISGLSPAGRKTTDPASLVQLGVNGDNFRENHIVRWNGSNRATQFVSSHQLVADVSTTETSTQGTNKVSVFDPVSQLTSNQVDFTITPAATTQVLPAQIFFSPQLTGTYSTSSHNQAVSIRNTGAVDVTIAAVTVSEGFFFADNNCLITLPGAYGSCTTSIGVHPSKLGSLSGTLTVTGNGQVIIATIPLQATGSDIVLSFQRPGRSSRGLLGTSSSKSSETYRIAISPAATHTQGIIDLHCEVPSGFGCKLDAKRIDLDAGPSEANLTITRTRSKRLFLNNRGTTANVIVTAEGFARTLSIPLQR